MELKVARKIARLTQAELAAQSGVDQTLISKMELGKIRHPSYETVVRLARALNVEPHELFPVADVPATDEARP